MKKILGLDLGTNSIGWAVVNADETEQGLVPQNIDAAGSRIIPMDASLMGDFDKGNSISQTADRTKFRSIRRLHERNLLRRERLHRVLNLMGFLPSHYVLDLDKYGKIIKGKEPKLAWKKDEFGKPHFLFEASFNEMLADFAKCQPQFVEGGKKVPYDWTLYYLRKKALYQAVTKEELAWLLLSFNQKRGYYQLRGEDDSDDEKKQLVELYSLKVVDVEDSGDKKGKDTWYNVKLENGWIYRRASSVKLDWVGKTKDFIVTTDLNDDGTVKVDKDGKEKRSFRAPKEDDWTLRKKKTECSIDNSGKHVGEYIYDYLLQNPDKKVVGSLVRTIERKYYRAEIKAIMQKQIELGAIKELTDKKLYAACIEALYYNNEVYRKSIVNRDFAYLLVDDILFYQRPLKSKKSTISDCPYEVRYDKDGNEYPIKCAAKSNPFFQEFRLWQFISNLRIYQREKEENGKLLTDCDVTAEFLKDEEAYEALFCWLNDRATIKQDTLLGSYFKIKKAKKTDDVLPYRWNYVEDKEYPCNKTRAAILAKMSVAEKGALSKELEYAIWHLLYSVTTQAEINAVFADTKRDNTEGVFAELRKHFSDETIEKLKNVTFDEKDYGSYSEKALKRLLPLMRMGKLWSADAIDAKTRSRIDKIITGEFDEKINERVREKAIRLDSEDKFRALPVWLACYIVYNRHSEASCVAKWESPNDIDSWLKDFKQHSLRNPIVEQVVTETMRTVRDIWKKEGQIDEIHIELGREMKNPADKRKAMTENVLKNENTNYRIKSLLMEFLNPEFEIEEVRPHSPSQQDILRIYEEHVLENNEADDSIKKIIDGLSSPDEKKHPSKSDVLKYKCWLEQKYRSPYTGEMISLSRLFTSDYEIEHVIPQSRYFDDSFSNKVICEAEVNRLKTNMLGYEFIKNNSGRIVQLSGGKSVKIFTEQAYQDFVTKHYSKNKAKMKKLLMADIPDGFIERQLNDSRYISKYIKGILSNIVREKDTEGNLEQEAVSKNIITCNGAVTDRLKKDWGVNDVWNKIILPRFKRLNEMSNSNKFTAVNAEGHEIPSMPFEFQKGFNKKRIDHRHHAMDAIVIACTTRNHVNLLNNESALSKHKQNRYALSHKLRRTEKVEVNGKEQNVFKEFFKPWDSFCADVETTLQNIIVSFKQNLRVINKTVNYYESYRDENGNLRIGKDGSPKKEFVKQVSGDAWAIRKSMHKDTVFGEVNLRMIKDVSLKEAIKQPARIVSKDVKRKVKEFLALGKKGKEIEAYFKENKDIWSEVATGKVQVYYFTKETKDRYFATRFLSDLVTLFSGVEKEKDALNKIESITDAGIRKILKKHLLQNNGNPAVAFSADGIDAMNRDIQALNDGKPHKPIYVVRRFEKADKFAIGSEGNKSSKFVEAAKGTNLFFAVFESTKEGEEKKRSFATVPLNLVIECQKKHKRNWKSRLVEMLKEKNFVSIDNRLLYILSPNDLVYLPEKEGENSIDPIRIMKIVSFTSSRLYAIPYSVAKSIVEKYEYTQLNKLEFVELAGIRYSVKDVCIPLHIDRLGNIFK